MRDCKWQHWKMRPSGSRALQGIRTLLYLSSA